MQFMNKSSFSATVFIDFTEYMEFSLLTAEGNAVTELPDAPISIMPRTGTIEIIVKFLSLLSFPPRNSHG